MRCLVQTHMRKRKLRCTKSSAEMGIKMGKIAAYLRLSLEDEDRDESNSISSQRAMISEYICRDAELSGCDVSEFCDDGYSGTNMDRPGMRKLLKEVKANKIGCVIVKDMSRFSRDYIELGNYMNRIFPFMGVRFIAINDNYDSREYRGSTVPIDTAFRTLLYDLYSKDISVKVRASLDSKLADGEYVYGQTPFGYKKSKTVRNAVVVEEAEAWIVRHIFDLALAGNGTARIARILNKEKIPTRMQVRYPERNTAVGQGHNWSSQGVRSVLNNRFYLGEMTYGRYVVKQVGSKNRTAVPKEKWKVIENHHEAIVTKEEYEKVCRFNTEASAKRKREKHPLTGKLFCGGCGYSMVYKQTPGKRHNMFCCWKHAVLQISECCTCISADMLEETVLFMLKRELMLWGNIIEQKEKLAAYQKSNRDSLKRKISDSRKDREKLQSETDKLYEDYAEGKIRANEYREKADSMKEKIFLLADEEKRAGEELAKVHEEYDRLAEDMKTIIRYSRLETLTQEAADAFIKKIYVYKDKRIEIEWSFRESGEEWSVTT